MRRAPLLLASIAALLWDGLAQARSSRGPDDRPPVAEAAVAAAAATGGDELALELAAYEDFLARRGKAAPGAIREALARGEPQDVIAVLFAADVEAEIVRESARGMDARGRRAERYAARKRAALAPADPDVTLRREYSQLPMVHVRVRTQAALDRLLARPEVAAVYEDTRHTRQLNESLPLIGQPAAAAAGHRGAGTTVIVLDTGVDFTRAAFGSCTAPGVPAGCRVAVAQDFAAPDGVNDDTSLHGTAVSGIVAGTAPETRLAVFDVFEGENARATAILDGLNWAILNAAAFNVAAVNMSLGGDQGTTTPCIDSSYGPAFSLVRAAGILPVVAAGNNAFTDRLGSPACTPLAVSVGAVYDADRGPLNTTVCSDPAPRTDQIVCFSDSANFVTILAPGASITAAGLTGAGTSLAAPFVSGAAAALKGSYPGETPAQIEARMVTTGVPITDPRNGITKPRLALDRAAAAATPPLPPPPVPCPPVGLSCPATVSGNLSAAACSTGRLGGGRFTDVYEFSGAAGQQVTIEMSSTASPEQFDAYVVLVSPSGSIAAQNDDIELGVDVNSRLIFTLNQTGVWRIEASTFLPAMTGAYTLSISGCVRTVPAACAPGPDALCLSGGRFRVLAGWRTRDGRSGSGNAVPLTPDTGYFWFFDPANVEMITKVLNACGVNRRIWAFAGGLTDVEVSTTVQDTASGASRVYRNPQGAAFLPIQDTEAFATCSVTPAAVPASQPATVERTPVPPDAAAAGAAAACTPGANALCLSGGRFRVTAAWRAADGRSGVGNAVALTAETGYFWFFDQQNVEMVVKVLNACGVNQRIWVFAGGLTNVEVTMTVEDTNTGVVQTYRNPQGTPFQPIQDTGAFATCP